MAHTRHALSLCSPRSGLRAAALAVLLGGLLLTLGEGWAWADPKPQAFQKGETVCVIGDSITHGGFYHSNLYLFYVTRFPDRELHLFNCGISGDTAAGAVRRLDWDILAHRPAAATVLLGMNDAGGKFYLKDDEKSTAARQPAIEQYAAQLTNLVEGLRKANVRTTLLTPTIYEQNADTGTASYLGYNDALRKCAEEVKKIAQRFDLPVVDVHAAMDAINGEAQKADPKFTLVGRDRVHPGGLGHMVIAYVLLKAQGMTSCVSKTVLAADSAKIVEQVNCKVTHLKASQGELSFDCLEAALPFPVPAGAEAAMKLVPFQEELNEELLRVTGLADGMYTLSIDDQTVGQYAAAELASGVNLAVNAKTPQYLQALAVRALNTKRHMVESVRLRGVVAAQRALSSGTLDMSDHEAVNKLVLKLSGWKPETSDKAPADRVNNIFDAYRQYKPVEQELIKEIEQARADMYKAAQPKAHRFLLKKG
jgi:lysophospholipase L1-like esterase